MRKGSSTGFVPSQVKNKKITTKYQKEKDLSSFLENCLFLFNRAKGIIMRIENKSPNTPPNLFGIDRKIAYANKKYHSGWMCVGVTRGLAGVKFSGSIRICGFVLLITSRPNKIIKALTISFIEK